MLSWLSAVALAHPVHIDANGLDVQFHVDGTWYRDTADVDLDEGSHTVNLGGFHTLDLEVLADGSVEVDAGSSHKAAASGATVTFSTLPVVLDAELYEGIYVLNRGFSWLRGDRTFQLTPGTYRIAPSLHHFDFEVAADGTVTIAPSGDEKAWAAANEIHLVTVPVTIDPERFDHQWAVHGIDFEVGVQVVHVVPGRQSVSPGGIHAIGFDAAADGTVTVRPESTHQATASGATLTFVTFPVAIDPVDYVDRWALHRDTTWRVGWMERHLPPGRYWAQAGSWARTIFDVAADGSVSILAGWEHAGVATDEGLAFVNERVWVDPGSYVGTWHIDQGAFGRTGAQEVVFMPGQRSVGASGAAGARFDVETPCSVPESVTDSLDTTFTLSCAEADPCAGLVGDEIWAGDTNGAFHTFAYDDTEGFSACGDLTDGPEPVTHASLSVWWNASVISTGDITTDDPLNTWQIVAQGNAITKISGLDVGGQYRWQMVDVAEAEAFRDFLSVVNGDGLLDELLEP